MLSPAFRSCLAAALAIAGMSLVPPDSIAADPPANKPGDKTKAAAPVTAPAKSGTRGLTGFGLPHYQEPAAYSVDLVVRAGGQNLTMKRFIDGNRIRSEMNAEGQDIVMIEMGDEKETTVTLMPGEKRAIKQTRAAMVAVAPEEAAKQEQAAAEEVAEVKVDDLGEETLDGRTVKKLRFQMAEGQTLAWFDKTTGAPVKMESEAQGQKSAIEWKNFSPGPQPAKLFDVPKGYEVMDMDEMMAKMKTMQGKPGMGAMMGAMGGMGGGMGGGATGMAKGYASGMAQNFGSTMGGSFGASLGGALGGPLGAIAGQYIGGKIGGMVAKKATDTVLK